MDINIRIAGEAGQGVQTTGNVLIRALAEFGLYVFGTQSYMSRIRGGLNWFDVRISDEELFCGREQADLLVALTDASLTALRGHVAGGGIILYAGAEADNAIAIDFTSAAKEAGGKAIMANAVAAGAIFALLGCEIDGLCRYLEKQFGDKDQTVAGANVRCARKGAELMAAHAGRLGAPPPAGGPPDVYSGAEAIALAAATAGVKFVASYPMSPSTAVFTYLAGVADEYGIVVEQAEDEIAAANMICGATYAGVPAMTTTSGGGFTLMAEAVSLAGMMELPIVIMLAQRPGPATGQPTRTAQQDLKLAMYAGHGEFPRAIFAPGTPQQAYEITRRAFETAHRFQSPAILLADQFLIDQQMNLQALDTAIEPIDRHIVTDAGEDYMRYAVSAGGISPRAIPGGPAIVICDSDEHDQAGHITEDLATRVSQTDNRLAKQVPMTAESLAPVHYGPREAETLLIAWGSTYGPGREAIDLLDAKGVSAAMLHFSQVWPLDSGAVRRAIGQRERIVSVEGNCTAQFASVLREADALDDCESILRYDGLPMTGEEIAGRLLS